MRGYPNTYERVRGNALVDEHGCHIWQGHKDKDGYARTSIQGRSRHIHRVTYEQERGEIPAGMVIDHLCRRRDCINPFHLEVVTPRENTRRGENFIGEHMRRTHCSHGHPLSGDNLYSDPRGFRGCRTCRQLATERYSAKGRA